jgi:hypothetical protein
MLVEPALHCFENMLMLPSVMRRCLLVVQVRLMAQLWQALVQYRRKVSPFSSFV